MEKVEWLGAEVKGGKENERRVRGEREAGKWRVRSEGEE